MLDSRAADWERGGARVPASQLVWARRSRRGRPSANDGYRASRTLAFVHHVAFRFADAARVIQASVVAGEFDIRARLRLAEPWVAEPWVRSSDSTRRTLGCRTLGCRTLGCRTLGCRTPGSVERFDSPNPGLPNPGLPNPGLPNPGSVERFPRCERAHRRRVALRRASVEVQRATASVRAEIRDRSSGAREPECNRFCRGAWISPCAALGRAVNPPKKKVHPRAHQCESARVRVQPLMNASRSGFTTSGCVVHMPCGSFG